MARRATYLDGIYEENVPLFSVDGGDLFGKRNKTQQLQTAFLCEVCGDLGLDAIGLGEQDLNYGLAFLEEMVEKFDLPFTNANVRKTSDGELILPEYIIIERNGIKIAIASVLDDHQQIVMMTGGEEALTVSDPVATMRELMPRLKKEAETVVLLSHLGEPNTEALIREVKGIDMCVIGHTYRNLNTERVVDDTALFGAAYEGRYIGRANLFLEKGSGRVMAIDVGVTSLDNTVEGNEDMQARVEAFKAGLVAMREAKRAEYPRNQGSDKESFLRDRACMSCHKEAFDAYAASAHRRAFATIRNQGQSAEPECLSCHTTGYLYKGGYSEEQTDRDLVNVQCEACHGYGTEHDRKGNWGAQAKDSCAVCHDAENSPDFDYATYWEKIKH